jgi:NAD(P) transhydrogenase subunit alpha
VVSDVGATGCPAPAVLTDASDLAYLLPLVIVGIGTEARGDERRVAMVPAVLPALRKLGFDVLVERGAGREAGHGDDAYEAEGARLAADAAAVFAEADVVARIGPPAAEDGSLDLVRQGQVVLGLLDPLGSPQGIQALAERGATVFALELLPRITRAQPMDALTSMATISGYKAVLLAAAALDRMFPLMMTAAGTITPARVFVIGAGVAGLQAIATAKRLGAVVDAYDVRPAVKEQVESLGVRFVELDLGADAEGSGGYAREMGEEFYRKQGELMARAVAESDVVITTAAVPGARAPVLITADAVRSMRPGSVIVDLAAETGGNCELTMPGETVREGSVTIMGPRRLPATVPHDASQMYAHNVAAFLRALVVDGRLEPDRDDEVLRGSIVAREGAVVHARVREALGLPADAERSPA